MGSAGTEAGSSQDTDAEPQPGGVRPFEVLQTIYCSSLEAETMQSNSLERALGYILPRAYKGCWKTLKSSLIIAV